MYRLVNPEASQELPLRMLFQPTGAGAFHRACEADSPRALVAALLDDPGYESLGIVDRLQRRIRVAADVCLLLELDGKRWQVGDRDGPQTINVHSDTEFLRSLERAGFVSLAFDLEGLG